MRRQFDRLCEYRLVGNPTLNYRSRAHFCLYTMNPAQDTK